VQKRSGLHANYCQRYPTAKVKLLNFAEVLPEKFIHFTMCGVTLFSVKEIIISVSVGVMCVLFKVNLFPLYTKVIICAECRGDIFSIEFHLITPFTLRNEQKT